MTGNQRRYICSQICFHGDIIMMTLLWHTWGRWIFMASAILSFCIAWVQYDKAKVDEK